MFCEFNITKSAIYKHYQPLYTFEIFWLASFPKITIAKQNLKQWIYFNNLFFYFVIFTLMKSMCIYYLFYFLLHAYIFICIFNC